MSDAPAAERSYVWLSELLEDPTLLEPPKAVVPRLVFQNRVTLLAAREKTGKSTLAGAAAAAVSSGRAFLGSEVISGNVLIVSLEEHTQEFAQRLVRFGADPSRIAIVSGTQDLTKMIWDAAEATHPALIIFDTLGAYMDKVSGAKSVESGDAQAWLRVLMDIVELSRTHGAVLLLHHSRKSDGHYRDSSAIGGAVDIILEMFGSGSEPRVIKNMSRLTIPETRFMLEGDALRLIETEAEIQERVKRFVGAHPRCSWQDLRQGVSGRAAEVQRARDVLVKNGAILNVGNPDNHAYILHA